MTEDQDVQPDPVVRTALQLLPVPPHAADFWDALDSELDAETPAGGRAEPGRPPVAPQHEGRQQEPQAQEIRLEPVTALVPPALRRRSNAVAAVGAVAAAVLVVVAASALIRERGGLDDTVTDLASSPTETSHTSSEATEPQASTSGDPGSTEETGPMLSAPSDDVAERSEAAVLGWIDALGAGDGDAAWSAMGPQSKRYFGDQVSFDEQMPSMSEGYGSWSAGKPDHVMVTPVLVTDEVTLVVVTLVGEVAPEGMTEVRADAFPVRITADGAQPEPFAFAGTIEFVVPEGVPEGGTRPIVEEDEVIIVVPEGAPAPIVRLDDGAVLVCGESSGTELTAIEGSSGQRCAVSPEGGIPAGRRVLTVAYSTPDGSEISGQSVLFEAA